MQEYKEIMDVFAREILDSRGNPTVEVEVLVEGGIIGRAAVPSGASTGQFEAVELRDGEKRYRGLGVRRAVEHVNTILAEKVIGENVLDQRHIDQILCRADGTENKANLGANAILGVSMAVASAGAEALELPLYRYLGGCMAHTMPVPMMNILNGGSHADNSVDLQEFMIMPAHMECFRSALAMCAEIYHTLKHVLTERGLSTGVGDEGGFAPDLRDSKEVLTLICEAVTMAGYEMGKDIVIAIDAASSELYEEETKEYVFKGEGVRRNREQMIAYLKELTEAFPIVSIEDPLFEDDWEGWKKITEELGNRVQLVGDDFFVTNSKRLSKGIRMAAANAILIKVNQIGTITEAFDTMELARKHGYRMIVSHRSGETEDTMIADIAVASGAGQIKTGAPCRTERVAKYNQLLRISEQL